MLLYVLLYIQKSSIVPTLCCFWYKYEIFHINSTPGDINFFDSIRIVCHSRFDHWWPLQPFLHWKFSILFISPWGNIFNTTKAARFQMKGLVIKTNWFLFETNRWFHSKVMFFNNCKILWNLPVFWWKFTKVHF